MTEVNPQILKTLSHFLFEGDSDLFLPHYKSLTLKIYQKDETIFRQEDDATALYAIETGWVKYSRQTFDGQEAILDICSPFHILGDISLFSQEKQKTYGANAVVASQNASILRIPAAVINSISHVDITFLYRFLDKINAYKNNQSLSLEHMSTMNAGQRLGCFLLRISQGCKLNQSNLNLPIEKNIIAKFLGMSPETFSRVLNDLKKVQVTADKNILQIEHIPTLKAFACQSCSHQCQK